MLRYCLLATFGLLLSASTLTAQTPNPAPAPTTAEDPAQEKMEDPQVGDHWTYEVRDEITGELKSTFTSTITDVSATDVTIRDAQVGNSNAGFANYDHSWNRTSNDSWQFHPNDGGGIRAPLAVGKTWSAKSNDMNRTAGVSWKRSVNSKVVAHENVTTRAGTFDTFEIEMSFVIQSAKDPTRKSEEVVQKWYAPSIDHWVKQVSVVRSDGRVRSRTSTELVEYGRR
jgi:hypothetical protein